MVQLRVIEHLHDRVHGARLGIVSTVNQTLDARVNQSACAHRAWFNCSKQLAVSQTVIADHSTGFAQRNDLSVRSRIVAPEVSIPTLGDDASVADHHCAYRDFTCLQCALRSTKSFLHEELIGGRSVVACRSLVVRHPWFNLTRIVAGGADRFVAGGDLSLMDLAYQC
jgi:hypothetical protein